jgi:hypothetical protein
MLLVAILFTMAVLAYAYRPFAPSRWVLLVVFTGMALIANRNISIFGVIAPLAWYDLMGWRLQEEPMPLPSRHIPVAAGVSLGLLISSLIFFTNSLKTAVAAPVDSTRYPVGAVDYLRQTLPQGNLFNGYNWGGYLTWALPAYPVFVDGRSNIYGDEIIQQSLMLEQGQPGWQNILAEWDIHLALAQVNSTLGYNLQAAGWQECYRDSLAAVYIDASQCP